MIKIILILVGAALLLGLAVLVYAAYVMTKRATKPGRRTDEQILNRLKRKRLYGDYDSLEKEFVRIPSFDGYELRGIYLSADKESRRFVITSHGIMDNLHGGIKYALLYHKLGFNVIMYDLRNHGMNKETYSTMGIRESKDLREVIGYVRKRFGEDVIVGIHGESLGCATSILCLDDSLKLAFCVADCGFSNLYQLIRHLMKTEYHVPSFFLHIGNVIVKLIYRFSFSQNRPIDVLKNNHTPILFVHGENDTFIPTQMSRDMYEANAGYKEIYIARSAEHAASIDVNPGKYYEVLKNFIQKVCDE